MPTTKEAFHTAHNALSAIELYISHPGHPTEDAKRKEELVIALQNEAQTHAGGSDGRHVLNVMADAIRKL
jgi:hypothetical protein